MPANTYLTWSDARNPVWITPANSAVQRINVEVNFDHLNEEYVEFTATPTDREQHGRDLYANCVSGTYGNVAPYINKDDPSQENVLDFFYGNE